MKKIRLGIIGLGAQGTMYANLIKAGKVPNMEIGAICDIDTEKRMNVSENFEVPFYEDYKEMIDSGDVDGIVTCVPHYLHPEMGIYALNADIHALIEKPAGVYTQQVMELNEFSLTKPDLTYAIMFNQRNNPLYQDLKKIIDNGEIGKIRRSNWIITNWWRPQPYYNQSEWRATWGGEGGGVLVNQAPHQLDLWQWICGVPKSVFAKVSYGFKRDIVVEDEVTILADYGEGVTGTFVTCTHDLVGTDRFEILGDKGKIVVEESKKVTIIRLNEDEKVMSANMNMMDVMHLFMGQMDTDKLYTKEVIEYESQWGEQHAGVLENFAANILDGTPLIADGKDGIYGVRLANSVHLSSWLEKEVSLEDFDAETHLRLLNEKIKEEGKFEQREV